MGEKGTPTIALTTIGCKLNQYETEGLAELFERRGCRIVPFDGPADAYVVNTCTVTGRSDYRCRQMIRRAARRSPDAVIAAVGCYAQRGAPSLAAMPETDIVVGNSDKPRSVDLVLEALSGRRPTLTVVEAGPIDPARFHALDIDRFRDYTRAFLKIQDGCDSRCAYCAVPDARGPSRSRPFDEVLRQARTLAASGYRELVLTGVHIGAYADHGGADLSRLIEGLTTVPGIERVRLGSIEPLQLTDRLADAIVDRPRVCRHLHVPLQSGSDRVLAAMRRGYGAGEYEDAVTRVTRRVPRLGLGADVMVGFPGESEVDFERTVELVERLPITYLHVFSFSPRAGTEAASMPGQIDGNEKKRRSRRLRSVGARKSLEFRRSLIGEKLEMLVLDARREDGLLTGLSSEYVAATFDGPSTLRNRFVSATIVGADGGRTTAAVVEGSHR